VLLNGNFRTRNAFDRVLKNIMNSSLGANPNVSWPQRNIAGESTDKTTLAEAALEQKL